MSARTGPEDVASPSNSKPGDPIAASALVIFIVRIDSSPFRAVYREAPRRLLRRRTLREYPDRADFVSAGAVRLSGCVRASRRL